MDIFVGSIPFKSTEKDLRELFEQHGTVESVKIVIDKVSRQNKGFGFVTMPNDAEASKAIKALNKSDMMGRTLEVSRSEKTAKAIKAAPSNKIFDKTQKSRDWKVGKNKLEGIVTFDKPLKTIKRK